MNKWYKFGYIKNTNNIGSSTSKVGLHLTGFTDYGQNGVNDVFVSYGSRGDNKCAVHWNIKQRDSDLRVGYVDDGTNLIIWIGTLGLCSGGIIEFDFEQGLTVYDTPVQADAAPSGFVDATVV